MRRSQTDDDFIETYKESKAKKGHGNVRAMAETPYHLRLLILRLPLPPSYPTAKASAGLGMMSDAHMHTLLLMLLSVLGQFLAKAPI